MNAPHKFKHNQNGECGTYTTVIYCEYCGLIAFHANSNDRSQWDKSKLGCPCSPSLAVGREIQTTDNALRGDNVSIPSNSGPSQAGASSLEVGRKLGE